MTEFQPTWQRQPGESSRWYDRFHRYMLAGARRSLLGTVNAERVENGQKRTSDAARSWRIAFDKYHWLDRAEDWDDYLRLQDRELWEARYKDLRENAWEMSREHLKRHEQMLRLPLFEQTLMRNEHGNTVAVTISPARWSYKDILASAQTVIELGAFAIGDANAAEHLLDQLGYSILLDQSDCHDSESNETVNREIN